MATITATVDHAGLWPPLRREETWALPSDRSLAFHVSKRALDIAVASALLLVLSPVIVCVALLIKLTSRGPVLFKQRRAGAGGTTFTMYKFRTMHDGAEGQREAIAHLNEQDGPVFKITEDPRVTALGRLLRQTSIDELPQLLNVLAGHMSLVGPRPLWVREAEQATGPARLRTCVKPGLTCLWQISGRSELGYDRWVELDLCYIRHRSMMLDLLILAQTIPAVLSGRGAY
jgi:lipopolysaccharide/colanic/teichoic acid biosynthesis glycosyltransferase